MGKISHSAIQHDDPWADVSEGVDQLRETQEWNKMSEQFFNAGYREGVAAGKESVIQAGFDQGFAGYGAPLGRTLGNLRGTATAAIALMSSPTIAVSEKNTGILEELKVVKAELDGLHFEMKFPEGCDEHDHPLRSSDQQGAGRGNSSGPHFDDSSKRMVHHEEKAKMQALQLRLHIALQEVSLGMFCLA